MRRAHPGAGDTKVVFERLVDIGAYGKAGKDIPASSFVYAPIQERYHYDGNRTYDYRADKIRKAVQYGTHALAQSL